jgi:hypothetical protein
VEFYLLLVALVDPCHSESYLADKFHCWFSVPNFMKILPVRDSTIISLRVMGHITSLRVIHCVPCS